ncbi:MAG TPA: amino acid ABC transporter substrate-binding protein [Gammaproteobacteria bacterium]|nr:amino acid ABC transporter substrate-binding protein [Gammaproteobacteria bacterium]
MKTKESGALVGLALLCVVGLAARLPARAAQAPKRIKVGTLYAGSGSYATPSRSQYDGLKFWVHHVNQQGGVYVKAFDRKIPVKLVAYDDQSSTDTATTLYNQLITQDHVDILVSDFGSVLTSVAVPLAQEHHRLLFDVTGTGAQFFTKDNPYVVLTSLPTSGVWPDQLAAFLKHKSIERVAILYDSNDFDQSQAGTVKRRLAQAGDKPVYYHAVPSNTSNYTVLLHRIAAEHPDALIEFGYPNNDIAFLQALSSNGLHFRMVFTVFPGQLLDLLRSNVGPAGLAWTYTYPTPPLLRYDKVNFGMGISAFEQAYHKATGKSVNFLTVAGYNAGLAVQKALNTAPKFTQMSLRHAMGQASGKMFTLDGRFRIRSDGAQVGETLPVGQFQPRKGEKNNRMVVVYPPHVATGKAVYPAPGD